MNLLKYRIFYFIFSLAIIIPGIISLAMYGLKPSIDFTGGSVLEVKFSEATPDQESINAALQNVYEVESVQQQGDGSVALKGKEISNEVKEQALVNLRSTYGQIEERSFSVIGPTLSNELLQKTLTAVALVAIMITLYVWKQFRAFKYGISAMLAMLHDSLVLLGVFSILGVLFGIEVDILFVTALLTTLSFSIHDTIVVFDRIRELKRKHASSSFESIVGAAVLETLGRSINNSVTILLMLLALVLLGGETIFTFALALFIGALTGTYSSTFTAAPLLLVFDEMERNRKTRVEKR